MKMIDMRKLLGKELPGYQPDEPVPGYLVHCEWLEDRLLRTDYTPDVRSGDMPFATSEEAWALAQAMADKLKTRAFNIYVVRVPGVGPIGGPTLNYR